MANIDDNLLYTFKATTAGCLRSLRHAHSTYISRSVRIFTFKNPVQTLQLHEACGSSVLINVHTVQAEQLTAISMN